jgi:regulator of sirC expression with transglutaminase-like and TPR domain
VQDKLISLGNEVIPRLEEAWGEEADERIQGRIEDIIHLIQSRATFDQLRAWKAQEAPSLLEGWSLVTRYQFPELDQTQLQREVSRLVNRMLFEKERYRANRRKLQDPKNYYLNSLIETRKGGPISLGMLYLVICQQLEIPLQGLILPGYFALAHNEGDTEFYVDVFNKGAFFFRNDLSRFLKEIKAEDAAKFYEPRSTRAIIRELVRILGACYQRMKEPEKVKAFERLLAVMDE